MSHVYQVAIFQEKKPCINILSDGVEGAELKTATRPLSLISLAARQAVDQAQLRGLCHRRFQADITLAGGNMPPKGARLHCGDLALRILPEGKKCFPECTLVEKELPCPLRDGVRFASIEQPGRLCWGNLLSMAADDLGE